VPKLADGYFANGYWGSGYFASGYFGNGLVIIPIPPEARAVYGTAPKFPLSKRQIQAVIDYLQVKLDE
jgi:hypothetical protein